MGLEQYKRQRRIERRLATERETASLKGQLEAGLPADVFARLTKKLEDRDFEDRLDYLLKATNRLQAITEIVDGADRVVLIGQGRVTVYQDDQAYPDIAMNWDVAAHVAGQLGRRVNGQVIERAGRAANTPAPEAPLTGPQTRNQGAITSAPRQIDLIVTYTADGAGAFARIHDGGELTEFKADGQAAEPPARTLKDLYRWLQTHGYDPDLSRFGWLDRGPGRRRRRQVYVLGGA